MIEKYRKMFYEPVLWLTVAQIVAAFGYFIKILGDTMAVDSPRSGMALVFMVFFGVVIIALIFGSICYSSVALRLSRMYLCAVPILFMLFMMASSSPLRRLDELPAILLALLSAAWWIISLAVLLDPPKQKPRTEALHLKLLRVRLYRPVLYVTILFTHFTFLQRIDWQGESPWLSVAFLALFTAFCVAGIAKDWGWTIALVWLYLIMHVFGSIGAFAVVAADFLKSRPLHMVAALAYGVLLPVWPVFLWIVHKPPQKPASSAEAVGAVEDQQDDSPAAQASP